MSPASPVGSRTAPREPSVLKAMPYDDADDAHILFEFFPEHALWTTWENCQQPGMRPVHHVWRVTPR